MMEALMQRPGTVVSRQKLEETVYGWGEEVGSNAIEVHMHYLRKKLGATVIGEAEALIVIVNWMSPLPVREPSLSSKTSVEPMPVEPLWL